MGIIGFGKAAEIVKRDLESNIAYLSEIRDALIEKILARIPESYLNDDKETRLPNNVNVRFAAIEGESMI